MTELLFRDDARKKSCRGVVTAHTSEGGIVVDRTIFYPTGGGQPGDSGRLIWDGGSREIATAVKAGEDGTDVALVPANDQPLPPVGTSVEQAIDWDRRARLMRMHTALHLLSVVIPAPVTGGAVGSEKGRLDFNLPELIDDKNFIQAKLSQLIAGNYAVSDEWITEGELLAQPDLVKTMSVAPPMGQGKVRLVRIHDEKGKTVDLQPCGGTHVANTSEIGEIRVGKIEKKGKINRRVSLVFA